MAIINKTVSQLCAFGNNRLSQNDLFMVSKDLNTTGTSEYVSFKIDYDQVSNDVWRDIEPKVKQQISDQKLGALAKKSYLENCYWNYSYTPEGGEYDDPGIIPSAAIRPELNELAFKSQNELNLPHLAQQFNKNYESDLKLSALAHVAKIELDRYGPDYTYLAGKLPLTAVDGYKDLTLSTYDDLKLNRLAYKYNTDYTNDLDIRTLAHLDYLDLATNAGELKLLRGKLPLTAVQAVQKFCSADNVNLADSRYITVPSDVLALSTYANLNLKDLSHKDETELHLSALAHKDSISLTSDYLTDKLPTSKMNKDQLKKLINNADGTNYGYDLPYAENDKIGGIRTCDSDESIIGSGNFGVKTLPRPNGNVAVIHIDDASQSKHGLMSANDKKKLDSAITENYTLKAATNTTLGGIRVSDRKYITDTKSYVQLDADSRAYVPTQSLDINDIYNKIYPVGSIYMTTASNCPFAGVFGNWVKVSSGRCICGADGYSTLPDTNGSASLPLPSIDSSTTVENGEFALTGTTDNGGGEHTHPIEILFSQNASGSGYPHHGSNTKCAHKYTGTTGSGGGNHTHSFSASGKSNVKVSTSVQAKEAGVYRSGAKVQPDVYFVNIFKRVS